MSKVDPAIISIDFYKILLMRALFFIFVCSVANCLSVFAQEIKVVPQTASVLYGKGEFTFDHNTPIIISDESQKDIAVLFSSLLHCRLSIIDDKKDNLPLGGIFLHFDREMMPESYKLLVENSRINIYASSNAGLVYGLQTLRQMLPVPNVGGDASSVISHPIPCVEIVDSPRFEYRGLMLDVSRYFIPKQTVLQVIDCMSMLKLNKLHLHLVDDNGWRLEIKKYPKLTSIGAWRVSRSGIPFPDRSNPAPLEPAAVGGFYSQDDIREMVSYAALRQVEIIPEIEMPAHTVSSLAAYPKLACPSVNQFIGVIPGLGGSNSRFIYCAGNDSVYHFLQDIIDEVVSLFPSKYIHLGGDEVDTYYWERCPLCKERIKKEKLNSAKELEGSFMKRMITYAQSKHKIVLGWDELTKNETPQGTVIMGWQGLGQAALKAAEQGHQFIMTPARKLYLIRYQGPQWFEPLTYFGNNTLKDVFDYEPVGPTWSNLVKSKLLGVQASLWTEFCTKPEDVEYLLFPRLVAFAEMAWVRPYTKSWSEFLPRLDSFLPRLALHGMTYARSMYNIDHSIIPDGRGKLLLQLSCIRPDVAIRFTTDGSKPSLSSPIYGDELSFSESTILKALTFKDSTPTGEVLTLPIKFNKATAANITSTNNSNVKLLVNGVRGSDRHTDFEWCGWYDSSFSFTIDLQFTEKVRRISLGTINNYGMAVHPPAQIKVEISNDGISYRTVSTLAIPLAKIFRKGTFIDDKVFQIKPTLARYVRISGTNPGYCPKGHIREGQKTWIYIDEVEIN